ncbi:MAG: carboxypeptidase regulatory-like domain-containing protein, partial [Lamprobacter sp.]|uniref:carboxypeptidase regulatory-like domain-containing protein n=1 Tax=Lamprobacter sp. TaxID=3100796 RepID=UPI002B25E69A
MSIRPQSRATAITLGLLLVGAALTPASAEQAMEASASTADERSMVVANEGGIRHISGGVGENERTELKAMANEFNLHLMFATQGSGEYLSAVQVNVLDAKDGPVLTALSKGPWFYAQLPPGEYQVEVTPTGVRGDELTQRKVVRLDRSNPS